MHGALPCGRGARGVGREAASGGCPDSRLDQGDQLGGQAGEVGQGLMDHDRLGRGRAGGGAAGRAFGRDAFALDQQDRLVGLAVVLGAIAFDEHVGPSVAEARRGSKSNIHILETTHKAT